jgi:hypothetical protein
MSDLVSEIEGVIEKRLSWRKKRQLKQEDKRAQDIYCHHCDNDIRFVIDMSLDGNHVLNCPNCDHEHCRVVKDGVITGDRWAQRNGITHQVATTSTFIVTGCTFTDSTSCSASAFTSWTNSSLSTS